MALSHPVSNTRRLSDRVLIWTPRVAVSAWAGFWIWFVLMVGTSDIAQGLHGAIPAVAGFLGALTALTAAVWIWPRLGGLALMAAGIGAAVYFPNNGARLLLAMPAILIGVVSMLAPQAGRIPR
jgi:hypothetical protein